jgi:myo-inositol 2-dehydrogenase/D-chiro-inositol 1-dehydrogenase
MGQLRARILRDDPRTLVAAVYDADAAAASRLAAEHGLDPTSTVEAAIDAADAVIVSTPAETHPAYVVEVARSGRAVFCEKPLGAGVELAAAAAAAVESAGVIGMVGFSKRFDPARRALEESVRAGELGVVEMVLLTNRDPNTTSFAPLVSHAREMHATAPYALVRESTVHDFDAARALLGAEPVELYAVGSTLASDDLRAAGEPDTLMVTMRTAGGSLCHINGSWHTAYGYDQRVEVMGSAGMSRVENGPRPAVVRHDEMGAHVGRMFEGPAGSFDFWRHAFADAYVAELTHFVDSCLADRPAAISMRDGLRAQMLVEAAVRSIASGERVSVPS